jgi:hypothetical protein
MQDSYCLSTISLFFVSPRSYTSCLLGVRDHLLRSEQKERSPGPGDSARAGNVTCHWSSLHLLKKSILLSVLYEELLSGSSERRYNAYCVFRGGCGGLFRCYIPSLWSHGRHVSHVSRNILHAKSSWRCLIFPERMYIGSYPIFVYEIRDM